MFNDTAKVLLLFDMSKYLSKKVQDFISQETSQQVFAGKLP